RKAFTSEEISQAERDVKALEAKLPAVYIQALLALDDTHDGEGSVLENFVSLMEESFNIRPNTSEMSNYYSVVSDGIRSVSTAAVKTKTIVEKANAVTEEMGPKIDVNSTTYITYLTNCYNDILLMRDACEEGTHEWEQQNKKLTELNEQLEEAQRRVMEYKRCVELANQEPLTPPSLGKEAAAKPTTFDFSTINNGNKEIPKDPFAGATTSANAYSKSLTNVSNSMRSIASATNESTAAWLNYGAGIATAIASAIPQIMALTIARKAEAAAGKEAAVAEGAASVASIPLVGWTMAIAAIAGIVAAFAAVPKFATGGIMGGSSFSGDRMLARINSGEMILNKAQQSNLFNMVNSGVNNSGVQPYLGNVEFKLRGKELVGVVGNYNKKRNLI
ncbi:MAG: hypothetical protein LUD74_02470, partial [Tannerellaceae bacterium]|nr:hypothetical protein [Tannerellaceae bacterium]